MDLKYVHWYGKFLHFSTLRNIPLLRKGIHHHRVFLLGGGKGEVCLLFEALRRVTHREDASKG
jgi:hypothetical protein